MKRFRGGIVVALFRGKVMDPELIILKIEEFDVLHDLFDHRTKDSDIQKQF